MLVYRKWLDEYCFVDENTDVFCRRMIMSGSNVESVKNFGTNIAGVVVGRIESVEKHPDADKLLVCIVDVGEAEPVQIVTGADNVFEGAYVPVILHGGKLPDGRVIKRGRLRGIESSGMLCSAKELGYDDKVVSTSHRDGIWILDGDYTLGMDIVEALGLKGDVIEFEITPNRPDCLSMVGMAREAAATFERELNYPDIKCLNETGDVGNYITVKIAKPELCNRYVARVVTDIKIKQSPWWMQKRLMYAGMRPINNIVDITNYVMLEYGQPIHAFDIRNLKDNHICVDTAVKGEKFTTLDGASRDLTDDMLMIKDSERSVAIAGVMGGLNSEIVGDTDTIVIESANFAGDSVRRTSKSLGLRTEASSRFEKGLDSELSGTAADRVCRLIELLGAGTVIKGSVDVYPVKKMRPTVDVRVDRVNKMLGTELKIEEIQDLYKRLEMETDIDGGKIKVRPPSVRQDLQKEIDFVEEAARIYGYDKLPSTLPKGKNRAIKTEKQSLRDVTKDALIGMGYSEVQTYSFLAPKGADDIRLNVDSRDRDVIKLLNPLGEDNSVMRTTLVSNMMEVLARNFSRNNSEIRAFELGNVFINTYGSDGLPKEQENLCIACYGEDEDFFSLKGAVEELLRKMGIYEVGFKSESSLGTYHPGRCATIGDGDVHFGLIGEIHPDVLENYDIDSKVWCCELNFSAMTEASSMQKYYSPLPKYPSVVRDISLVTEEGTTVEAITSLIYEYGKELLEKVELFDIYRGKQVPEGKKSVSFALAYRDTDKTLTDNEVDIIHNAILEGLNDKLNAVLRKVGDGS
ncbi:MAG TPA: phenylalanine--tRNA ligase subunit beta [Anaerovoracaceae bacterium]|nr:phenylalanine--tRNA ligase subunit beta [Anaerovoracaceae bacterium]